MEKIATCGGFTLLELLVSLAIVGIITATAVPQYNAYRRRGYDYRAQSDLQMIALAEEAYFLDAERYLPCTGGACVVLPGVTRISKGVQLQVSAENVEIGFIASSSHPKGTGKTFKWDSERGGIE